MIVIAAAVERARKAAAVGVIAHSERAVALEIHTGVCFLESHLRLRKRARRSACGGEGGGGDGGGEGGGGQFWCETQMCRYQLSLAMLLRCTLNLI